MDEPHTSYVEGSLEQAHVVYGDRNQERGDPCRGRVVTGRGNEGMFWARGSVVIVTLAGDVHVYTLVKFYTLDVCTLLYENCISKRKK